MTDTSKYITYILRHNPSDVGIELDEWGWADVNELLDGINAAGKHISTDELKSIVALDEKKRYSFSPDGKKIRANYGHSVRVDCGAKVSRPPDTLYHGTAEKYLDGIKRSGIEKRARQFVHLSSDRETATNMGARHGKHVVLKIDAARMYKDGYIFFLAANGVWLTDGVPIDYITEVV